MGDDIKIPRKWKVAIVGCTEHRDEAPYDDDSWEIWGVNNLFLSMPGKRWTRWFDLHHFEFRGKWLRRGDETFRGMRVDQYLQALAALGVPVYMQAPCPLVPTAVEYPIRQIVAQFGNYFTNTISYQIALALHEGFRVIGLYGVDLAVDTEYHWQRPSCEYFIGIARGRGVEVIIPDRSDLLKTRYMYGYQDVEEMAYARKLRGMVDAMRKKLAAAEQQRDQAMKQVDQYIGALSAIEQIQKTWKNQ